jgi:hypothetical protein
MTIDGSGEPVPVAVSESYEVDAQFSPDGKWAAYTSDESGELQVYVRRWEAAGNKLRVSTAGGGMARWRRDGSELFYIALDGKLMAVPLRFTVQGTVLEALSPVALFDGKVGGPLSTDSRQQYAVAADGQRFLMNTIAEQKAAPISVLVNWQP